MKKSSLKQNKPTLFWIKKSIKGQYVSLCVIIIISAVAACMGSVSAMIIGSLVDSATAKSWNGFVLYAILLALLYLLNIALSATVNYIKSRTKAKIDIKLRKDFFALMLKKDYSKITEFHSGELMNRMTSDVSVVSGAATDILPTFSALIVKFVCALSLIIFIQPWLAFFYCVCGVAVFFASRIFRKKIKSLHKVAQKADDDNRSFWQEALYNLLAVKVFAASKQMNKRSDDLQNKSFKARMNSARFSVFASTGYSLLLSLGYVFAFIWCGVCLLLDIMTFGGLMSVIQLIGQLQAPFSGMSGVFTQYYVALASAERLIEIENLPDEPLVEYLDAEKTYSSMDSLDIVNMSFKYDRDFVFSDASLSMKKGEFVGIIGNSGIGKSTLFKLILGVYSPEKGQILITSENGNIECGAASRTVFAYVPQGNVMFSGTIRENVLLINPNADENALLRALEISCANEFINELPDGLETQIGEKGLGLSEGQSQRIAIARALVSNAPILLLDEATSALDGETEAKFLDNLRKLSDVTCIIVTHRKKALSICNRTLEIKNGIISEKSVN